MAAARTNEAEMLASAIRGDRNALAGLLQLVGPRVRARIEPKISASLRSSLDADDVMQVTYIETVLRATRFSGDNIEAFVAWMTRLAENNLIDAVRALEAKKRPPPSKRVDTARRPAEDSKVALIDMLSAGSATPSRVFARAEAVHYLDLALSRMPPDYEKVVRMYDLEGRPMADIAGEMRRSEGALWMLRARAHDRLRDEMGTNGRIFSSPG